MILSCNCSFIERLSFMKTIVIASQKGGSGKTMLAARPAVEAERAGDTAVDRYRPPSHLEPVA